MMILVPYSPPRYPPRRFCLRLLAIVALLVGVGGCVQWDEAPAYPSYQPAGGAVRSGQVPSVVQVQRGDSVYAIARRYGVPMRKIIEINGLNPPYMLYPGQTLRMPAQQVYRVARGDTLYGISRSFGVNMNTLARVNKLKPPYIIYPGQSLVLPGQVATAVADNARPTNTILTPSQRVSGSTRVDPPPLLVDRQKNDAASDKATASSSSPPSEPASPSVEESNSQGRCCAGNAVSRSGGHAPAGPLQWPIRLARPG